MTPQDRAEILSLDEELLKYATADELALYGKALEIESKLLSVVDYMEHVTPTTKRYPHLMLLGAYIDALLEGCLYADGPGPVPVIGLDPDGSGAAFVHPQRGDVAVYNLCIHEPPRHGKSFLVSAHLPAYFLTKYAGYSVILASYEEEFAKSWGEKVRDTLADNGAYFGVEVSGGKNAAKGFFSLKNYPYSTFKAAGAGASITGRGGQLLIVDDPVKNSEEAQSEPIRQKHEDWWWSTFFNRRETWKNHGGTPARVIMMNTRWHEDDLRGRVVDKDRSHWCVLNVPAICEVTDEEPVDPLGRKPGEPICEEIIPLRDLTMLRKQTPLWFEAMYQGRPFVAEGNIIRKPFQHYTLTDGVYTLRFLDGSIMNVREDECLRFSAVDLAASTKTTADWTVMGTFDLTKTSPRYLLVRDIERIRVDTEGHRPFLERTHQRLKPQYALVEKQTYGTNLINAMQRSNSPLRVRPVAADKDKVTRANGTAVQMLEERRLFFPTPEDAPWYVAFEKELLKFPNATHDDQVDVLSYACQEAMNLPSYQGAKKEYAAGGRGRLQRLEDRVRSGKRGQAAHPDLGSGY